jgi:hypothetical protein
MRTPWELVNRLTAEGNRRLDIQVLTSSTTCAGQTGAGSRTADVDAAFSTWCSPYEHDRDP